MLWLQLHQYHTLIAAILNYKVYEKFGFDTFEPRHDKMSVRPAKTQISLGICLIRVFAVHSVGS